MKLRQLEYFVAVAEERHFGRAAERLRVAQPGISQQIKILERSLGTQLFIRGSDGVQLTESGEALLDHARLVIELADRTREITGLAGRGRAGLVKVGTAAMHALPVANEVIGEFRKRFPLVEVELHPGFGPSQFDLLRRRMLDTSFVTAPFEDELSLRHLTLGALEIRVVLPDGHPLAALDRIPRADLLKERYIGMPRAADPALIDHAREEVFGQAQPHELVEVADTTLETRLRMVADGQGFTLTIRPEETDLPSPGVVYRHIAGRTPTVEYGMAWLDAAASSFVSSFVETAERIVAARSSDAAPRRRGTAKEQAS
jgi:DNA-binding transcriptional LysR family regulator